jgi:hypothetical protein
VEAQPGIFGGDVVDCDMANIGLKVHESFFNEVFSLPETPRALGRSGQ